MSLEYGQIDEVVGFQRSAANAHRTDGALNDFCFILFQIIKGYIVCCADFVVTGDAHGTSRSVADPASFHDADVFETVLLKVFDCAAEHTGMCGRAGIGIGCNNKIGLERDGSTCHSAR